MGAFLYGPASRAFLNWRADRLVTQSAKFAAAEKWEDSRRTALASLQIRTSVEGLRLLFAANRASNDPAALHSGVALFRQEGASAQDRLEVITAALDERDLLLAAEFLRAMGEQAAAGRSVAYQQVRLDLALGERAAAFALADRHASGEGGAEFALLLAQELGRASDRETQAAVVSRLGPFLDHPDRAVARRAMVALAHLPSGWDLGEWSARAVARFGSEADLSVEADLALATHRITAEPAGRDGIVIAMVEHHGDDLGHLLPWLVREEEWERVVELTDGVRLDAAQFNDRSTALHRLQRFEILLATLANPPVPVPTPLLLAARAAIRSEQGHDSEAILLWQEAMKIAEQDHSRNVYYGLARIAHETGVRDREMEAMLKGVLHRRGVPPGAGQLESLFAWLHLGNRSEELLAVTYRLLQREPHNPVLLNNYHYLRILKGEPAAESVTVLRSLVEALPEHPGYRGSLALALLCSHQPGEAARVIEELDRELTDFGPAGMAIYAGALAALERTDDLEALRPKIDWKAIPATEAGVLRGLIDPAPEK